MTSGVVRRVWAGSDVMARVARGVLFPAEVLYAASVAARGTLYDRGWLPSRSLALPAISIGNLTVGGTGKTPVAAWVAAQLVTLGARPAIALRGYGGDEVLVHAALNPAVPVVTGADRLEAAERARALGADVAVLDDAFQHRRARREVDVVLVSADAWSASRRLLPAGPWREPLSALRRASLVIATRKAVAPEVVDDVRSAAARYAPSAPFAAARLAPAAVIDAHRGVTQPLASLAGADIFAVAGVGDPAAFARQLADLGARVQFRAYSDHYPFDSADAADVARAAAGFRAVVCTLKDAVKLAPVWPADGPALWYLTQQVILERGRAAVERMLGLLLEARARYSATVR